MLKKIISITAVVASVLSVAAQPAAATIPASARLLPAAAVQAEPDLRQECAGRSAEAARTNGWTRSRFEHCFHKRHESYLFTNSGQYMGFFKFDIWVLGFTPDGSRRVDYVINVDKFELSAQLSGDLTWLTIGHEGCAGRSDIACSAPLQRSDSSNAWYAQPRMDPITITSPDTAGSGDFLTVALTSRFNVVVEYRNGITTPDEVNALAVSHVRFDSAGSKLGNGKHKGAVFTDHVPTLELPLTGAGIDEEARHVDDAQNNPERTFPSRVGKNVPGKTTPLHRLMNSTEADANHRGAVGICTNVWGPEYAAGGQECDEYPFKTTYEGSSKSTGGNPSQWNGSARPINGPQNRAAGTKLGVFYGENRILDNDAFYVKVI